MIWALKNATQDSDTYSSILVARAYWGMNN